MALDYLMISCPADSLAVALSALKGRPFIQINFTESTNVNYLGFVYHTDMLVVLNFAKRNGFAFKEITEAVVREKRIEPGKVQIKGDQALVPWLK